MATYTRATTSKGDNIPHIKRPKEHVDLINTKKPIQGQTTGSDLLDHEWAMHSFLTTGKEYIEDYDNVNRTVSTVRSKFYDTQLGGNVACNARPQYTRFSDPRDPGVLRDRNKVGVADNGGHHGMGRCYSEYYDDQREHVFFRMGVPEFNSLDHYLRNFSNPELTSLASRGAVFRGIGKFIGKWATYGVGLYLAPPIAKLMILGSLALHKSGLLENNTSKFYTLRPMMARYWSAVNIIVNIIMTNEGFIPHPDTDDNVDPDDDDEHVVVPDPKLDEKPKSKMGNYQNTAQLKHLNKLLPGIFTTTDGIDVASIVSKTQRRSRKLIVREVEKINKGTEDKYLFRSGKDIEGLNDEDFLIGEGATARLLRKEKGRYWFSDNWEGVEKAIEGEGVGNKAQALIKAIRNLAVTAYDTIVNGSESDAYNIISYARAEGMEGTQFAAFDFDYIGAVSDSFTNSVGTSALADGFNAASSSARSVRFNLAGGNISEGVGGSIIESVTGLVGGLAAGGLEALNKVSFGITGTIGSMFQGTNMVIPKRWESSTAEFPTMTYTTTLISPSQHPIARLQNIYIPMAMMMAMALPMKTGKQSFTNPFTISTWHRGKIHAPLSIVSALSIERGGASNLGHDEYGRPLSIVMSMTLANLDDIMPLTIAATTNNDSEHIVRAMTDDNAMTDYLNAISGLSMEDQIYVWPRFGRKSRLRLNAYGTAWSAGMNTMHARQWLENGTFRWITSPMEFIISGVSGRNTQISR